MGVAPGEGFSHGCTQLIISSSFFTEYLVGQVASLFPRCRPVLFLLFLFFSTFFGSLTYLVWPSLYDKFPLNRLKSQQQHSNERQKIEWRQKQTAHSSPASSFSWRFRRPCWGWISSPWANAAFRRIFYQTHNVAYSIRRLRGVLLIRWQQRELTVYAELCQAGLLMARKWSTS